MAQKILTRELNRTRLANSYGGWIYCDNCNNTIGYLCYVTYHSFKLDYTCSCGNVGKITMELDDSDTKFKLSDKQQYELSDQQLITLKNRLCCPNDQSPLVTILSKKLKSYSLEISCKGCRKVYKGEGKNI
jgi:uncharacterized protein YbaR (Trm112 family)